MIAVISPAKSLDFDTSYAFESTSVPYPEKSMTLVKEMQTKTAEDLQELMKVSEKIAQLNVERFYHFSHEYIKDENAKHALFAFNGDVYQGLDAQSLSEEDVHYAQGHLRILSGLYALLRPLDLIQAYRLEMGTRLKFDQYKNLYDFWGNQITALLNQELEQGNHKYLLNLASNEYFKSVKKKELKAQVLEVDFKDYKNGQYKTISFFAKKARGMMTRFFIENKCQSIEEIQQFDQAGYNFSQENSSKEKLVFLRKQ